MKRRVALGLLSALAVVALFVPAREALSAHQPANKIGVSANTMEVMTVQLTPGATSLPVTLLQATMRASSPTDLVLQVSGECALWTDVMTTGNATSTSVAEVEVWVEIDGVAVPVSSVPTPDDGKVVFANREFTLTTLQFDDQDAIIQIYNHTKAAHAFDWVSLNVGSGIHSVVVKAQLKANVAGTGRAKAAVVKRTLVAEPTKLTNDIQF